MYDIGIIGAGIIGLAAGMQLSQQYPHKKIVILDKEATLAYHQTGHNSGVIHSGIYYQPNSLKAQLCRQGCQQMLAFCKQHNINYRQTGKLIVAVKHNQLDNLNKLYIRAQHNKIAATQLTAAQIKTYEPHLNALSGIHIPSTGTVNYQAVANQYANIFQHYDNDIKQRHAVLAIHERPDSIQLETSQQPVTCRYLIVCAGLQADRLAAMTALKHSFRIVPFRGEYFRLNKALSYLVKGLIYPVPNPAFPFLGVHFTRTIHDEIKIGPNALWSLAREDYRRFGANYQDIRASLSFPGFWRFARRYWRTAQQELRRSLFKSALLAELNAYFPTLKNGDVSYSHSGIRAQCLLPNGKLVDDFHLLSNERCLHVCNAPSPAATASLAIGHTISQRLSAMMGNH